jgi:hypothetical protein
MMPTIKPPNLFEQLGNPDSPEVKDAVTRVCRICEAPKGAFCTNITNGQPLATRLVHFDRTSA